VENMEEYEPYIMLTLVGVIAFMWLSHHFLHAHWWQRETRKRLKRMKENRRSRMELNEGK